METLNVMRLLQLGVDIDVVEKMQWSSYRGIVVRGIISTVPRTCLTIYINLT